MDSINHYSNKESEDITWGGVCWGTWEERERGIGASEGSGKEEWGIVRGDRERGVHTMEMHHLHIWNCQGINKRYSKEQKRESVSLTS